jgi:hypothetical protein
LVTKSFVFPGLTLRPVLLSTKVTSPMSRRQRRLA